MKILHIYLALWGPISSLLGGISWYWEGRKDAHIYAPEIRLGLVVSVSIPGFIFGICNSGLL
jgi:hypothetical protein